MTGPVQPLPYEPVPPGPGVAQCRVCGCVPAVRAGFYSVQGMAVIWRVLTANGPFCRDCGIATFRRMTGETLVMGWWFPLSLIVNPIIVVSNLLDRRKVIRLAAPSPPAYGPWRRPMEHGRRILTRADVIAVLTLVLIAVALLAVCAVLMILAMSRAPLY